MKLLTGFLVILIFLSSFAIADNSGANLEKSNLGQGNDDTAALTTRNQKNTDELGAAGSALVKSNLEVFNGQGFIENSKDGLAFPIHINVKKVNLLNFKKYAVESEISGDEGTVLQQIKNRLEITNATNETNSYWFGVLNVIGIKGSRVFRLVGVENNDKINFVVVPVDLLNRNQNTIVDTEGTTSNIQTDIIYPKLGKLVITRNKYPLIDIWKGEGEFGRTWNFVAYGKSNKLKEEVKLGNEVDISDVTVQPVSVRRQKFFGVELPWAKKIVKYKITKAGVAEEKEVEMGKEIEVEDLKISTAETSTGDIELELKEENTTNT